MESLSDTEWDIVISGTGLPQSLLALALSRSDKKVLHVDRNKYYGGPDAALSLQDAENWVKEVKNDDVSSTFRDAEIHIPDDEAASTTTVDQVNTLTFSRAYSLSLSPQLIYTRSVLLPTLVSSKIYRQLEFLAVGSWWIYQCGDSAQGDKPESLILPHEQCSLKKIPGGREDVFADKSMDFKSKRALMNFLRLAADPEAQSPILEEWGESPFQDFLRLRFGIPTYQQAALHALTLSPQSPINTKTSYALPRITRHLSSIGVFGPGFGSVIPKWGGIAEIAQVACRAGAVGGGVYVLGQGVIATTEQSNIADSSTNVMVQLQSGDTIRSHWIAGMSNDLPSTIKVPQKVSELYTARSVTVVSSALSELFPVEKDGAPPPAGAVVVFPAGTLGHEVAVSEVEFLPVYLMVHSSETGECPVGQCVIYSSIGRSGSAAYDLLNTATLRLFDALKDPQKPRVLWRLQYSQAHDLNEPVVLTSIPGQGAQEGKVILFPKSTDDLAFDDSVLQQVRRAWQQVSGEADGFMRFEDREVGAYDDDDE